MNPKVMAKNIIIIIITIIIRLSGEKKKHWGKVPWQKKTNCEVPQGKSRT